MRVILILICFVFNLNLHAQAEKGKSLFVGVNVGTKIGNKNYAWRYSGYYSYFGTDETQLEHAIYIPDTYNKIRDLLGGFDFEIPYDSYPLNINYTPGLLTGITLGYQISPNLQVTVDGNLSKLTVKNVFTVQVYDGSIGTTERQIQLGYLSAKESRFDGRFNFDYIADGNKAKFIIGASGLYSFWRMDEHTATFKGVTMPLFSKFSVLSANDIHVVRGTGWGLGLNLGVEYRINEKIVSQIMYQPYQSFVNYGYSIQKRILLQHDIAVRFFWK